MIRNLLRWSVLATTLSIAGQVSAQQALTAEQGVSGMATDVGWGLGTGTYTRAPQGQSTGLRLSQSSILHAGVGAEAGFDSNVFFSDADVVSAPILRVTPFLQVTNATREGAVPSAVYYDLNAALQYREYLSDDEDVRAQRALNPVISGSVALSSGRAFTLVVNDAFVRTQEAPYVAGSEQIVRNSNAANLTLQFAPGGGRLRAQLRYTNRLDIFETEAFKNANNMGHELVFDGYWLWLPKTALFLQVAQGYIHYLQQNADQDPFNPKFDSLPLRAVAGLRGLLTSKLGVQLAAGYANGFYQGTGENTGGLSQLIAIAELNYRPTVLSNITLGYRHEFRDSIIGTFYEVDAAYLGLGHTVDRLKLFAFGRYELRRYSGLGFPRTDSFASVGAQADYFVQNWLYAGVAYTLAFNSSDVDQTMGGVDYNKQLVFGRLGFVY